MPVSSPYLEASVYRFSTSLRKSHLVKTQKPKLLGETQSLGKLWDNYILPREKHGNRKQTMQIEAEDI